MTSYFNTLEEAMANGFHLPKKRWGVMTLTMREHVMVWGDTFPSSEEALGGNDIVLGIAIWVMFQRFHLPKKRWGVMTTRE